MDLLVTLIRCHLFVGARRHCGVLPVEVLDQGRLFEPPGFDRPSIRVIQWTTAPLVVTFAQAAARGVPVVAPLVTVLKLKQIRMLFSVPKSQTF